MWDRYAKRLRGPEIDNEFELGRLLDRQLGKLGARTKRKYPSSD